MTDVSPRKSWPPDGDQDMEEDEVPLTGSTYKIGPPTEIASPIPQQRREG